MTQDRNVSTTVEPGQGRNSETVDVLVVGAGPSGLMAASLLARYGVQLRVIDQKTELSENSRALVIHPRSLEIFEQMGIVEEFLKQGQRVTRGILHEPRGRTEFPIYSAGEGITRYAYGLMLEQTKTERLLLGSLHDQGVAVEWGTRLTTLAQDPDGVRVRVTKGDGDVDEVRARYVIAADGASSTVRKTLDVPFTGETAEQRFAVLDADVKRDLDENSIALNFNADGEIALFPITRPGRFRIVATYPPDVTGDPSVEHVEAFLDRNFPGGLPLDDIAWFSHYRIHSRSVARFRVGRVMFVGDAAHVHTPVGGQGMNTGLQDAHNLAWKLADVLARRLPDEALDSYHSERHPVAKTLVATTDSLFSAITKQTPFARWLRVHAFPAVLKVATRLPGVKRQLFLRLGQVGISYDDGQFLRETPSGLPRSAPRPGHRWPYIELRMAGRLISSHRAISYITHHVYLFADPRDVDEANDALKVLSAKTAVEPHVVIAGATSETNAVFMDPAVFKRFRGRRPAVYLVRPDGYVGFVADSFNTPVLLSKIENYLGRPEHRPTNSASLPSNQPSTIERTPA